MSAAASLPDARCHVRIRGLRRRFLTRMADGRPCWTTDYDRAQHFPTGSAAKVAVAAMSGQFDIVSSDDLA